MPQFEKVLLALKVGDISLPVATPFGYHIIKLVERTPALLSPSRRQRSRSGKSFSTRRGDSVTTNLWHRFGRKLSSASPTSRFRFRKSPPPVTRPPRLNASARSHASTYVADGLRGPGPVGRPARRSSGPGRHLHDRIVAVVNTEVITLSELEEEVGDVKAQTRQRYSGAELVQRLRQIDYMGLNRMIERKLQVQIASGAGSRSRRRR